MRPPCGILRFKIDQPIRSVVGKQNVKVRNRTLATASRQDKCASMRGRRRDRVSGNTNCTGTAEDNAANRNRSLCASEIVCEGECRPAYGIRDDEGGARAWRSSAPVRAVAPVNAVAAAGPRARFGKGC